MVYVLARNRCHKLHNASFSLVVMRIQLLHFAGQEIQKSSNPSNCGSDNGSALVVVVASTRKKDVESGVEYVDHCHNCSSRKDCKNLEKNKIDGFNKRGSSFVIEGIGFELVTVNAFLSWSGGGVMSILCESASFNQIAVK